MTKFLNPYPQNIDVWVRFYAVMLRKKVGTKNYFINPYLQRLPYSINYGDTVSTSQLFFPEQLHHVEDRPNNHEVESRQKALLLDDFCRVFSSLFSLLNNWTHAFWDWHVAHLRENEPKTLCCPFFSFVWANFIAIQAKFLSKKKRRVTLRAICLTKKKVPNHQF